jgi:uncharacterized oligopeptide transporter (OPT) family protein
MRQLTWRAVIMGSVLGGVLSLTNLYIGLKAGWGFGVAITACILSYAIWTTLHRLGVVGTPMTILSALRRVHARQQHHPAGVLFLLAVLGVTIAIPMKRKMINIEQLRFPSGIAAAETLHALHSTGSTGMRSAKALGWAALIAAAGKLWADGLAVSTRVEVSLVLAALARIHLPVASRWIGGERLMRCRPRTVGRTAPTCALARRPLRLPGRVKAFEIDERLLTSDNSAAKRADTAAPTATTEVSRSPR